MTLQKGCVGQQDGVYDLTRGVYDTSGRAYGAIEYAHHLPKRFNHTSEGVYGTIGECSLITWRVMWYFKKGKLIIKRVLMHSDGVQVRTWQVS